MRLDADHTAVYLSRATVRRVLMEVRRRGEVADADEAIGALVEYAVDSALNAAATQAVTEAEYNRIVIGPGASVSWTADGQESPPIALAELLGLSGDGEDDGG